MTVEFLLPHLQAFIGFARSRTGDPDLAADLVQECLIKAIKSDKALSDREGAVTWFYRVLRNAIIDAHRRKVAQERALEKAALDLPESLSPDDEKDIGQCVIKLLSELPSGDAELIRRIDLDGESVSGIAKSEGERVNTLNVRLHRARQRLRAQVERTCRVCATHGCLDCSCQ